MNKNEETGLEWDFIPLAYIGSRSVCRYKIITGKTSVEVDIPIAEHTPLRLLELAPIEYWERHFQVDEGPAVWLDAATSLIWECKLQTSKKA